MKQFLLMMTMVLGLTAMGLAQDSAEAPRGGRIEALKIAYLTKKLNLTTEEAQKFWPIYNQYSEEIRKIRIEQRQKSLSELDVEDKLLKVRKKYNGAFEKALSPDKVNKFFQSEKEFGVFLQREMLERRQQRMQNLKRFKQ